jgi:hypothetical protein
MCPKLFEIIFPKFGAYDRFQNVTKNFGNLKNLGLVPIFKICNKILIILQKICKIWGLCPFPKCAKFFVKKISNIWGLCRLF